MELYDAISIRRSVRVFTEDLSDEIKQSLIAFINQGIKPLFPEIGYEIVITDKSSVKSTKAPAYILFYSEEKDGYQMNAGYILQQLDLFLQSKGAGTCWLGMTFPEEKSRGNKKFVIMLDAGMTEVPYRKKDEFDRKPLAEIGDVLDKKALEAVRLAPSAMNKQPWFYKQNNSLVEVLIKRNIMEKVILGRFNEIDLGISLLHYVLAMQKAGIKYRIFKTPSNAKSMINIELLPNN